MTKGRNLAKGKTATQSSTYLEGYASKAVDGNTTVADTAYVTCAHTDKRNDTSLEWWNVDLGNFYPITGIKIYNRNPAGKLRRMYVIVTIFFH